MSAVTAMPSALGGTRYKEVKEGMLAALSAQEWKGGEAIPSEKRLAERFGVSIGTLRKAIDELCAENILIRHQGLGTFVAMHRRDRHFFRYFRVVRRDGERSYPVVTLVNFKKGKATRVIAAKLGIAEGTRVFIFTNALALHEKVVMVESITLPETIFPTLSEAMLRDRPNTLYNFYQDAFGINVVGTDEHVRVSLASELEGTLLALPAGAPVLEVERVAYSYNQKPVEYRLSHVNTAEYEYVGSVLTTKE
ncbi:GntR family transcriptional regulator [Caballeronia ptereochthonis]|uniref:GntR family transcriptional regulator n=1 Tax=Caballeronia ptereochthonis TaxID=1777144 RepID=A0A158C031_9BURK|nr:GntR family transcriptional regulator [Caballeronia ptereochthonis]SAK75673.1 GntR family transcriptional regulator [Caballeronia ptereochthonis]